MISERKRLINYPKNSIVIQSNMTSDKNLLINPFTGEYFTSYDENQEYDPKKHCCEVWWKEYCDCIKKMKKEEKEKNINSTIQELDKAGIKYEQSNVPSIVIIEAKSKQVRVSLKKEKGMIKYQYAGYHQWYKTKMKEFILKLKNNQI
jgi:hypothetical protein